MPVPPWVFSASPGELDFYNVTPDLKKFDKKSIYITDARRVGIMLRDKRLTLRNHSAMTRFIVDAISETDFILQAPSVGGDKPYVTVGDKGAFFAQGSREEALKFQIKSTEIGFELYLADQRPAVFDDHFDVSVGKWTTGLSSIPLLVHTDLSKIWKAYEPNFGSPIPSYPSGPQGAQGNMQF